MDELFAETAERSMPDLERFGARILSEEQS
jgi:hypothetical protein